MYDFKMIRDSFQFSELEAAVEIIECVDSTNSEVKTLLASGMQLNKPFVLLAERQTQGRGRGGKVWVSQGEGSITLSIAWHGGSVLQWYSGLSLAVGCYVISALSNFVVPESLCIKWPNDIYLCGKKLAGILVENSPSSLGYNFVIGIGLNYHIDNETYSKVEQPVTSLFEDIPSYSREQVIVRMISCILSGLREYEEKGFDGLIDTYAESDFLLGKSVIVTTANRVVEGTVRGINKTGALRVFNGYEELLFHSADVSLKVRS